MKPFVLLLVLVSWACAQDEGDIGRPFSIDAGKPQNKPPNAATNAANTQATNYCVNEHNRVRRDNGLSTFNADDRLENAARKHNEVMERQNCFNHQCSGEPDLGKRVDNEGYNWSGVAENIAKGYSDCQAAVEGWMNSDGHRRNILGNYRHIGCHKQGPYYTCVFGKPM